MEEDKRTVVPAKGPVRSPKGVAELWSMIDERFTALEDLIKTKVPNPQNVVGGRGPVSTRAMNKVDAHEALLGKMKDVSIKDCAIALGLSYGQIYSARNGYTFKDEYALRVAEKMKTKAR
jgi:enolase